MLNLVGVRRFPLPLCFRFTLLVLPFWCRLTRVVPDKIQEDRKTVVVVCVCVSVHVWCRFRFVAPSTIKANTMYTGRSINRQ